MTEDFERAVRAIVRDTRWHFVGADRDIMTGDATVRLKSRTGVCMAPDCPVRFAPLLGEYGSCKNHGIVATFEERRDLVLDSRLLASDKHAVIDRIYLFARYETGVPESVSADALASRVDLLGVPRDVSSQAQGESGEKTVRLCRYVHGVVRLAYRRLLCSAKGHEPKCYTPPGERWMKPGKAWCAYCARFIEPSKLPGRVSG